MVDAFWPLHGDSVNNSEHINYQAKVPGDYKQKDKHGKHGIGSCKQ